MVNYGVSRACLTCKTRRIKCDEQRPTCRRCSKSKRTCLGYRDNADVLFRDQTSSLRAKLGECCGQPISSHTSESSNTSRCEPDSETNQEVVALKMFFRDYVLVSRDQSLSRGYLDGLESLLKRASPDSELVSAVSIVALSSAAGKAGSVESVHYSSKYADTLAAFQKTLDNPGKRNADEALMTAVLLGLYEMIVATEPYPNAHGTHLRGISAILCTRELPFNLLELAGSNLFELFNPLLPHKPPSSAQIPGLLSPYPISKADPPTKSLDLLMIKLRPILDRASKILSNSRVSRIELRDLRRDASLLNKEFSLWPLSQPEEWMPQTLGVLKETTQWTDERAHQMPFWPGHIDSYFDLYVVAVWDIYRKARLKLLDVIFQSFERAQSSDDFCNELPKTLRMLRSEIQELIDGLCASVPFHLVADLPSYLQSGITSSNLNRPGKALGGLLLMYPLYIASSLTIAPLKQRLWMRERLRWIGKSMGIRQATRLADNVLGVSHNLIGVGHSLLFAGALLQPGDHNGR